jgi:SnoaL-like domain
MDSRWADVEQIKQLKAQYFRFVDTKDWDRLLQLFTADARIEFPEINRVFTGGASFVRFAQETMAGVISVHVGHMPEILLHDNGAASGIWGMTDDLDAPRGMPHTNGAPVRMRGAGHYHEEYVKIEGAWKIASMKLTRLRLDVGS